MKLKEQKQQGIMFYHAQAGMNGVKFTGVKKAEQYWNNSIIENQINPETKPIKQKDGLASEADIKTFMSYATPNNK